MTTRDRLDAAITLAVVIAFAVLIVLALRAAPTADDIEPGDLYTPTTTPEAPTR